MPRRSPENRSAQVNKDRDLVRRKYKKDMKKKKRIRPGEEGHIINQLVILKIAGYSNTQMGRIVGVSRGQVKEMFERPEVTELLNDTRENLTEAAYDLLQGYSIEAVQTIASVMRSSEDDKMILTACAEILDRAGIPKASRSEQKIHKTSEELTTISSEDLVERLRDVSPEIQEQAAQMVENLEALLAKAAEEGEVAEDD